MSTSKTAIVKVGPSTPAVRKRAPRVVAEQKVSRELLHVEQSERAVKLSEKGGKAACWGMIASAAAMSFGLVFHAGFGVMADLGTIGTMVGVGIYGLLKDSGISELDERIRGIDVLYARGLLTEATRRKAHVKALKDAHVLDGDSD